MAIFTRVNGDAQGVVYMDPGRTAGNIVALGLTKSPTVYLVKSNVDVRSELVTGGAVETVLRAIAVDSTIVMYQVENAANGNVAVMVEATGANASVLQTRLQAISSGGNIGVAGACFAAGWTVQNTGFSLLNTTLGS